MLIISGYNIKILPYSWYALISGILDNQESEKSITDYYPPPRNVWNNKRHVLNILEGLKKNLKKYWSCF